jgi:glycosyltransferase involved in cell wall biosynthesis
MGDPLTADGRRGSTDGRREVLIVSAAVILGGAELSMLSVATRLPDYGWTAVIACPPGAFAAGAAELGVGVAVLDWRTVVGISTKEMTERGPVKAYSAKATAAALRTTASNTRRVTGELRRRQPDVVLSNSLSAHLAVAVAGRLTRTPAVWFLREIVDPGLGRRVLETAGRSVTAALSISPAVTRGLRHPNIIEVPEPIEPPEDVTCPARRDESAPVIGYLGRVDPPKGVEDVVRAAGLLNVTTLIAGAPHLAPVTYLPTLQALADSVAPGRVQFLGPVSEPWDFLRRIDVLVVPSRREPWGRVAAEALTVGVPVVAADAGGLPGIVRHGVDGLLYPPGDVDALVRCLRRLLEDAALRRRMSRAGRSGASRFRPDAAAKAVSDALTGVVEPSLRA